MRVPVSSSTVARTGRPEVVPQVGHARLINALAISPTLNLLATGSDDHSVRLWDTATGVELRALFGHAATVRAVALTPDGTLLASGGVDSSIRVWNVRTGDFLGHPEKRDVHRPPDPWVVEALEFSPDGRRLAAVGGGDLQIWNTASLAEELLVDLPSYSKALAWSCDGTRIATGHHNGSVMIWDTRTGLLVRQLGDYGPTNTSDPSWFGRIITSVAFAVLDDVVVAVDAKARIYRWHAGTGRELPGVRDELAIGTIYGAIAFSPDGTHIATLTQEATVWDARTMTKLAAIPSAASSRRALVFDSSGSRVVLTEQDPAPRVWNLSETHDRPWPTSSARQPDLIVPSHDGRLVCLVSGDYRRPGSQEGTWLHTWELSTGIQLGAFHIDRRDFRTAAFTPDGRLLLADRGRLRVVDPRTGADVQPETRIVRGYALAPAGDVLLTLPSDSDVAIVDVRTQATLRSFQVPIKQPSRVVLDWSGQRAAMIAWNTETVELWDTVRAQRTHMFQVGTDLVSSLAFNRAGDRLVVGEWNGTIQVWDLGTERQVALLEAHSSRVLSLAYSPDGRLLWSASQDGTTRLWDARTNAPLAVLTIYRDSGTWLALTPEGLFDGPPPALGRVMWRFNNDTFDMAPVEAFFNEFFYPGLLADLVAGRRPCPPSSIATMDRRQPHVTISLSQDDGMRVDGPIATRSTRLRISVSEVRGDSKHGLGSGARDLRLFRNGTLVRVWRGDLLGSDGAAQIFETTVSLVAGENNFTTYVFNRDNVKSRDAVLKLTGAETLRRAGTAWIFTVGVNRSSNRAYDLRYAVPDALAFGRELSTGLSARGEFASVQVIALTDSDATKENVMACLRRLAGARLRGKLPQVLRKVRPAQPEDVVILYFATHGTVDKDRFYLLPHDVGWTGGLDVDERGLALLLKHSISDRELEEVLEPVNAGKFLIIIDACKSGQALEAQEKRRGPMNSRGLVQLAYEKGIDMLTAAQGHQPAFEAAQLGHGLLTYALVQEGLKERAADTAPRDGVVYAREWLDYAAFRVPNIHADMVRRARSTAGNAAVAAHMEQWDVQRPRAFYRREPDPEPLALTPHG